MLRFISLAPSSPSMAPLSRAAATPEGPRPAAASTSSPADRRASCPPARARPVEPNVDRMTALPTTVAEFNAIGQGCLPGLIGVEVVRAEHGHLVARLPLRPELLAPNGFLHAASVIALADTACGYGCVASLPDGATGFTTIELKSNFLRTLTEGALACNALMVHGGGTTQLWDATVTDEANGTVLALFRCTQLVLRPR